MIDHSPASPSPMRRPLRALACLSILVLGGSQASALPRVQVDPTPGFLLVQGGPSSSEQRAQEDRQAPFAHFYEVLDATRAKLEELTEATAIVVADTERREKALEQDNQRLAAELEQANARRAELEKLAEARIADLTKSADVARREAARLNEDLARLSQQNEQLNQNLARADAAREAAVAEAEKIRAETAGKLKLAADQVEQVRAELAGRSEQLEANRQALARANSTREQVEARVIAMEEAVERSGAEAERLKKQLAEAKEQLGQTAGAAVAAERARQAASSEAEALRGEAERARQELTAARTEIARFKTANAELEKQMASLHRDSRSATEAVRRNLIAMEEKIEELNAALDRARPEEAAATDGSQAKPEAVEDERDAAAPQAPSAMARPPAPESAGKTDADQPADSATARSRVEPAAAPSDVDSRLTAFRANVQALNRLELNAEGVDLFSGVESVAGREVHVSTTAAWDTLPLVGKESYLDSLLDAWVAAQGGEGRAVVRIVDPSGQVLVEKSWP